MSEVSCPPEISVALCVHNGNRFLRQQLDSVLAQTGVSIEIVALDDASTDESGAVLREYAARDPRVRHLCNSHNLGPSRSFERAMALSRGKFIAPCDQDDVWKPEKLERLLNAIGRADLAYCDSEYTDEAGARTGKYVCDDVAMMAGRDPLKFLFANSVSGHAALLRRSLFESARPFPMGTYYDWWLALCAAAGNGVVYFDEPLVEFRRHPQAFSTLGRDHIGKRPTGRHRLWLEQRRNLWLAYSASAFEGHAQAAALLAAFDRARQGEGCWPLLQQLWRLREAAPGEGLAARRVIRLQLRFLRKLRRAREEPAPSAAQLRL